MITIHEKTAQNFDTLGLGALLPSSCVVTEEINGAYELKMKHPYDEHGKWERIERGRIITVSTPRGVQYFRIYNTKPNMDSIEVNARHVFYDLLDNQCSEINFNGTAPGALAALQGAFAFPMPFFFDTDISVSGALKTGRMNPVQVLLTDDDETTSFVKGFGGELLRDGFNVSMLTAMGQDRDVAIRYGKNLVGLDVTEDEADVKTRIQYHGSDGSGTLDSPFIHEYVYPKIHLLEDENKTKAELEAEAQALFDGGIDIPLVNIKVDFIVLADTVEYANYAPLEEVFLGDIVTIINQKMNFAKMARVISYEWDCLLEKYNEVELGDFMPTLASSVTSGVRSGSLASAASVTSSAVAALLNSHMNDFSNPHKVTSAQTGGGSGGSSDADAILELLVEHEEDINNPHAVTLEQVGFTSGTDDPDDANGNDGDIYLQAVVDDAEYTEVEYITSDGSQFINTKHLLTSQNLEIEMEFIPHDLVGGVAIGGGTNSNYIIALYQANASSKPAIWVGSAGNYCPVTLIINSKNTIKVTANNGKLTVVCNGVTQTATYTGTMSTAYSPSIFAQMVSGTTGSQFAKMSLCWYKMRDNGVLIRDYIAVIDPNGVACLFDNISETYFYNAGSGDFTIGAVIERAVGVLWLKQNGTWTQVLKGAA